MRASVSSDPKGSLDRHTWIELNARAYRHNIGHFRKRIPSRTRICVAVKANAYGHGLREMVRISREFVGIDWFAVHTLQEAKEVQDTAPTHPVLILGYVPLRALHRAVRPGVRLTVWNPETVHALSSQAHVRGLLVPVHIKLETGTNRHGVHAEDITAFVRLIDALPGIKLEGLSTHYANIEDTTDYSYARHQTEILFGVRNQLHDMGHTDLMVHSACSAAALLFPATHLDMIRIGISAYGIWPSKETLVSASSLPGFEPLRPVLTWKARLSQVKSVPEGQFIGYGCTYRATRSTLLGIVPVGYSEGYPRHLSGRAHALFHGQRAPLRGRVCMNIIMVDLTDVPDAHIEAPITLIGHDGDERVTATDLAALCGTIPYEILARLSPAIPRIIT